ncbi:MAG: hypothetical protein PW843_11230 [Azospirillaceae bacterium]|nr:hypothetical protein [Azospirillaceae bacterium]
MITPRLNKGMDPVLENRSDTSLAAPRARRRVCVIGNSYTGAVKRAYQLGLVDTRGHTLNFFANPGPNFINLRLDGKRIVDAPFSDGGSDDVDDYDAFVVYGDTPTPVEIRTFMDGLSTESYSRQVRAAALRERLLQSHAYRICGQLLTAQDRPVFLLSRNYSVEECRGNGDVAERTDALFAEAIRPACHIPFPVPLFGGDGHPLPDLYSGSLNVDGVEPDRIEQPHHHLVHLNQTGGALVLAAVLEGVEAAFPPPPFTAAAEKPQAALLHRLRRWVSA